MGQWVPLYAVATADNLNDEDVAALENTYLRAKLDSVSGAVLSQLLQQNLAEILESKEKAAAVESGEREVETELAISPMLITTEDVAVTPAARSAAPEAADEETAPLDSVAKHRPLTWDAARKRVVNLIHMVTVEAWSKFLISIDGSEASDMAMAVCLEELMSSKDGVIALHCFDSTKKEDGLETRFMPEALKEEVYRVQQVANTGKGRYSLKWVDKMGESTSDTIVRTVNDLALNRGKHITTSKHEKKMAAPSYLVSGVNGQKRAALGSLPVLAAGKLYLPNIIVRKPPILNRGRVFVVAIRKHRAPRWIRHRP